VEKRVDKVEQLYNILKEAFILLDDGDRHLFNEYDLSPPRFYAMVHINEEPGISSSELSARLLCDKSNVTRIVRGLEQQGLIQRKPHETDGRTLRLYLTEQGLETCNHIQIELKHYNETRFNNLDNSAQNILLQNLNKLNQSLQTDLATKQVNQNGSTS
jgi:DNA-binding MarR family transcriptional regulator